MAEVNYGADRLLDINEVATLLKISDRTVRRLATSGTLRSVKVGNVWRFRREWIAQCVEATSEEVQAL